MTAATAARAAVPARRRPATWLAITLLSAGVAMVAFMFVSAILPGHDRLSTSIDSVVDVIPIIPSVTAFVSLTGVGAILAIRRPGNPVGWVMLLGGIGLIAGDFSATYVERSLVVDPALPGHRVVERFSPVLAVLAFPLLTIWLPLLFPDGRLPGPRWRAVAIVAALTTATYLAAAVLKPGVTDTARLIPELTVGSHAFWELIDGLTAVISGGLIVMAAAAVVVRFRGSRGTVRQQMKWFLASVSLVVAAVFLLAVRTDVWGWGFLLVALTALPISIGLAVLRYRLYDIDRLISRTIGWTVVTGTLIGTFVFLVLGLQAILEPLTGGNTLAIAGSTLVVAALFQPVRSRVQGAVDRRFDRSRYDGERLLAAFGERLRDEVDLSTISADMLATTDAAVRPARAGLWLRGGPESGS